MNASFLSASFKLAELRQIARLLGKTRSGTKPVIAERIVEAVGNSKPLAPGTRILSIDLGIRNLAYSLLEVPGADIEPPATKTKKGRKKTASETRPKTATPILHAWERLALIPRTSATAKPKKRKPTKTRKTLSEEVVDEDYEETPEKPPAKTDKTTTPVIPEDFSPTRLSALAVDLILTRLLPLKPDIITLEQQRARSMGGSGVFEWTLRVNSLESMLYAAFTMMQRLGKWTGGRVEGVVARNVLEFMVLQEKVAGVDVAKIWGPDAENKKVKKAIVRRLLAEGEGVSVSEAVEPVAKEYLDVWEGKVRGQKKSESFKKLDDMADCLLQGLAFASRPSPSEILGILMPVTSIVTSRNIYLPEVLAYRRMPTPVRILTIPGQGLETPQPRLAVLSVPDLPRYHITHPITVLTTIIQETIARVAVPPCPAGLLVVPLKALGHPPVHHEPHVLLVDAHTEGRSCNYNIITLLIIDPPGEGLLLGLVEQLCVEGPRADALLPECGCDHLAFVA
ncbi:Cruciform cutting endonuclease 1, mitochondrial [Cytospora mali]|uniref:Cruciform cutting endonuclease 1, mitochondrial n=1 Tax=Cytospora mali TaxID=578113 RepID=A0A194VC16_CYTMA|nr:Cruciform cutting endonuclease 1, mitochondrial [Valsa mali var. pyri (nom. inval.)]